MSRECGSCSLCCFLPRIEELNKPPNKWCQHCNPGPKGCTVYNNRPADVCNVYECGWLQDRKGEVFPDQMRPDLSHVLFAPSFKDAEGKGQGFLIFYDRRYKLSNYTKRFVALFANICKTTGIPLATVSKGGTAVEEVFAVTRDEAC